MISIKIKNKNVANNQMDDEKQIIDLPDNFDADDIKVISTAIRRLNRRKVRGEYSKIVSTLWRLARKYGYVGKWSNKRTVVVLLVEFLTTVRTGMVGGLRELRKKRETKERHQNEILLKLDEDSKLSLTYTASRRSKEFLEDHPDRFEDHMMNPIIRLLRKKKRVIKERLTGETAVYIKARLRFSNDIEGTSKQITWDVFLYKDYHKFIQKIKDWANSKNYEVIIDEITIKIMKKAKGGCWGHRKNFDRIGLNKSANKSVPMRIKQPKSTANNCFFVCIQEELKVIYNRTRLTKKFYNEIRREYDLLPNTMIDTHTATKFFIDHKLDINIIGLDQSIDSDYVSHNNDTVLCGNPQAKKSLFLIDNHYLIIEGDKKYCAKCDTIYWKKHSKVGCERRRMYRDTKLCKSDKRYILLGKNKKTKKIKINNSKEVLHYDIETHQKTCVSEDKSVLSRHETFALGYAFTNDQGETEYYQIVGDDCFTKFIEDVLPSLPKHVQYLNAYNGSNFDHYELLREYYRITGKRCIDKLLMNNGSIIKATLEISKTKGNIKNGYEMFCEKKCTEHRDIINQYIGVNDRNTIQKIEARECRIEEKKEYVNELVESIWDDIPEIERNTYVQFNGYEVSKEVVDGDLNWDLNKRLRFYHKYAHTEEYKKMSTESSEHYDSKGKNNKTADNRSFTLIDLCKHAQGTLGGNLKELGCKVMKGEIDYERFTSWEDTPDDFKIEISEYLKCDVLGLKEFYDKMNENLFKSFGVNISHYLSTSHMAYTIWKNNFLGDRIELLDYDNTNFAREAVYGGRTYPNKKEFESKQYKGVMEGQTKYVDLDDYIEDRDVVSLYPTAMLRKYPIGDHQECGEGVWMSEFMGIYDVSVECPKKMYTPYLPRKSKNNGLNWDLLSRRQRLTSVDIKYAMKLGYKFTFHKGIYWTESSNIFADYVNDMYKRKKSATKGTSEYQTAKLFLNSLYGKMIQKPILEESIDIRTPEIFYNLLSTNVVTEIIEFGDFLHVKYRSLLEPELNKKCNKPSHLGAFILSYSRVIMYDHMKTLNPLGTAEGAPCYGDTDSLQTHVKNSSRLPIGKNLGDMDNDLPGEGRVIKGIWIAPKLYMMVYLTNKNEIKSHIRGKGVPKKLLEDNIDWYQKMLDGEAIESIPLTNNFKKIHYKKNSKQEDLTNFSIYKTKSTKTLNKSVWSGRIFESNSVSYPIGYEI